jgi:hypothetical protein
LTLGVVGVQAILRAGAREDNQFGSGRGWSGCWSLEGEEMVVAGIYAAGVAYLWKQELFKSFWTTILSS